MPDIGYSGCQQLECTPYIMSKLRLICSEFAGDQPQPFLGYCLPFPRRYSIPDKGNTKLCLRLFFMRYRCARYRDKCFYVMLRLPLDLDSLDLKSFMPEGVRSRFPLIHCHRISFIQQGKRLTATTRLTRHTNDYTHGLDSEFLV